MMTVYIIANCAPYSEGSVFGVFQVKLNPSLVDAWLCLGNCIWKKGDLPGAKNCFTLALSKVNCNQDRMLI